MPSSSPRIFSRIWRTSSVRSRAINSSSCARRCRPSLPTPCRNRESIRFVPGGFLMAMIVEIENIEEMRLREGIDDIELRMEIRELKVGDFVRLTISKGTKFHATMLVRVTQIRGSAYRGKLVKNAPRLP